MSVYMHILCICTCVGSLVRRTKRILLGQKLWPGCPSSVHYHCSGLHVCQSAKVYDYHHNGGR